MARRRYRKRNRLAQLRRWGVPLLALVLVGGWYVAQPVIAPDDWVTVGARYGTCGERGRPYHCVTDGDTVTIGFGQNARRIRLTGFDAPEIKGQCPDESARALLAQRALLDWLNKGQFEWSGGTSPRRDRYGRELREVRRIGRDGRVDNLADHMIDAKLASGDGAFEWRDWCD